MHKAKKISAFLAIIFLAACASNAGLPTPALTTVPITQTQPEETIELDALSLNLTEFASLPTSTITSTISPFKFLSIEETPQPEGAFEVAVLGRHLVSPNGQWALVVGHPGFYVIHSSGEVIWELPLNVLEALEIQWAGVFSADQWSPDSRYLFFTYFLYVDHAIVRGNGSGYWQLDIVDGTIKEILPIRLESSDRALALSPSQNTLVYIEHGNPLQITFHEIETQAERIYSVPGEYYNFGNIIWSANEDFVLYVVGRGPIKGENYNKFALIMFDVNRGTQSVIFERIDIPIYLDWLDENTLEIRGSAEDESVFFDIDSRAFVDR